MRVAAHQVDHLSWLGYFARIASVDVLVDLDCVQYNHGRFQNRNRLLSRDAGAQWLTVPVVGGKRRVQSMRDTRIAGGPWRRRYLETVRHAYGRHPHFDPLYAELEAIVSKPWERLLDLNRALREMLAGQLGIQTPVLSQSELGLAEIGGDGLLVRAIQAAGGSRFLSGPTGHSFLDPAAFESAGMELGFDEPFRSDPYPQHARAGFQPDLSTLDLLMNLGAASGDWLRDHHVPR